MDKEVLGLSVPSPPKGDFYDLLYPRHEDAHQKKKDDILSSYDFQPIRSSGSAGGPLPSSSVAASMNLETTGGIIGGGRAWNSADSKANPASGFRNYDSLEPHESAKAGTEKDMGTYNPATVIEIDQTMKKHTDNLLHALEGVSARLSQLESRTQRLESSVDDLKTTISNNHGSIDGKLRQMENTLREVQTAVQTIHDKQEIAEAQLDQPVEKPNMLQTDSPQRTVSQPQESIQPQLPQMPLVTPSQVPSLPPPNAPLTPQQTQVPSLPPPIAPLTPPQLTQVPSLPPPNAPLPPPQQNPPPVQTQLPQNTIPSMPPLPRDQYHPLPGQPMEVHHQQYQIPPQQPPPPNQQYQGKPSQLPPYSQPAPLPQQHQPLGPANSPPQLQPSLSHHPEESLYMSPPQSYPPTIRQPVPPTPPPAGSTASQQIYGLPSHMYEPSGNRPSSGQPPFSAGYGLPLGLSFSDSYPYSGSPSQYSGSVKPPQHSSPSAPTSGSNYPRLPTAQILPHALPTATSVSSAPSSGGSGNRVAIDDVIDKVALMGFPRDQVRATVRKLTENGQSVDLNVVLDKLMNDGDIQPQKGWFGR